MVYHSDFGNRGSSHRTFPKIKIQHNEEWYEILVIIRL